MVEPNETPLTPEQVADIAEQVPTMLRWVEETKRAAAANALAEKRRQERILKGWR